MTSPTENSLFDRFTPVQRSLLSGVAGFLFYGAWAFWVNSSHGMVAASKAACVQGAYSFVLTLCMTLLLEAMFRFNTYLFNRPRVIDWLTIVECCAIVFAGSWAVNVAAGTPEVFRTVILGYFVGGIYCAVYVFKLSKQATA